jgi:trigger factor
MRRKSQKRIEMTSEDGSAPVSGAMDVQVTSEAESASVHRVSVSVDAKRVDKVFDRVYREIGKTASVRGFRKGKVPRSVVQKLYGASVPQEVERILLNETIAEAVQQSELEPLVEPTVEARAPAPSEAFEYTLGLEVRPPIELPNLKLISAKKPEVSVGDEDIDAELERMRLQNAPLLEEPEDKQGEVGSTLNVDFVGRVDGDAFEGGTGQDMEIELGSGRLVPGFEDQLVGAKAGDDVLVKVTFPEDYPTEELAGKDAEFSVHVASIRRRQVPDLDDEFAKDVGEFDTLAELRAKIEADMTSERERGAENVLRQSLMDSLISQCEFDVPPGIVDQQLQRQIHNMRHQFEKQMPADILEQQLARMHEEGRPAAERRVREGFLMSEVVRSQQIEASDEDVDARLDEMAEAQGMPAPELHKMAEAQGWKDSIRAELVESKALDFLASEATVEVTTEAEPS